MKDEYGDTAEGAIECLRDLSIHDVTGATAYSPEAGVWIVTHKSGRSRVFLKGYGHHGLGNDFEDED